MRKLCITTKYGNDKKIQFKPFPTRHFQFRCCLEPEMMTAPWRADERPWNCRRIGRRRADGESHLSMTGMTAKTLHRHIYFVQLDCDDFVLSNSCFVFFFTPSHPQHDLIDPGALDLCARPRHLWPSSANA